MARLANDIARYKAFCGCAPNRGRIVPVGIDLNRGHISLVVNLVGYNKNMFRNKTRYKITVVLNMARYPFSGPEVYTDADLAFHPNIDATSGYVCIEERWNPYEGDIVESIAQCLLMLQGRLFRIDQVGGNHAALNAAAAVAYSKIKPVTEIWFPDLPPRKLSRTDGRIK